MKQMHSLLLAAVVTSFTVPAAAQQPTRSTAHPQKADMAADFTKGYARGVIEQRLIMVFFRTNDTFSTKEQAEFDALREDPVFEQIFVFAESVLPTDAVGMKAATQLKMKYIPAIGIYAPDRNELRELTRFEGIWSADELRSTIVKDVCARAGDARWPIDTWTAIVLGCGLNH